MMKIQTWAAANVARILAVALAIVLVAVVSSMRSCGSAQTARTTATLATGQAGAALTSGADAVDTVGNRMDADATTDAMTRESDVLIRNAQGAEIIIPAPVHDAGITALCRRAAYKDTSRCKR